MKKEIDPRERLRAAIREAGNQRNLAKQFGVSQAFICHLVKGRTPIPEHILKKLGLQWTLIPLDR